MQKATTKDVAELAGVSRATVSYVLNETPSKSISEATRKRVLEAADKLEYRPNPYAVGLKTQESKTFALVIVSLGNPSIYEMIKGIQDTSYFNEYCMILHELDVKGRTLQNCLDLLCARPLDGIIIAYPDINEQSIIQSLIEKRNIPTVIIGREFPNTDANSVSVDFESVGHIVAEHLYGLGHRNIAICCNYMISSREERIVGAQHFLESKGLQPIMFVDHRKERTFERYTDVEYNYGFCMAEKIVRSGKSITAAIMMTPWAGIGLVQGLEALGKKIPDDFSVITYTGTSEHFHLRFWDFKITMCYQMNDEVGKAAFELLIAKFSSGKGVIERRTYQPRLILGDTTSILPSN